MRETLYAEAIDAQGRRVEYGPFKRTPVALQHAKHLVQQGFHGVVVVGYVREAGGLIRESRVLHPSGRDISRAYWLRQLGARST